MSSYSQMNVAWGRFQSQRFDAGLQAEVRLAADILRDRPKMTRDQALREAARIIRQERLS